MGGARKVGLTDAPVPVQCDQDDDEATAADESVAQQNIEHCQVVLKCDIHGGRLNHQTYIAK